MVPSPFYLMKLDADVHHHEIGVSITSQTKTETFGLQEIHRETTDDAWHKIAVKAFLWHLLGRHEHTNHGDPEGEEGECLKPSSPVHHQPVPHVEGNGKRLDFLPRYEH